MERQTMNLRRLRKLLPRRDRLAHKGMFGRVLIVGGCVGYTGAPRLAAEAALKTGSGLIFVGVPHAVYPITAAALTEPMPFPLPDSGGKLAASAAEEILRRMERCDACLLGVGMGRSDGTQRLVHQVLKQAKIPIVLDADGINALEGHIDVLRETACPVILTPHDGEFARLGGVISGGDRIGAAAAMAEQTGKVVLLKGHRTVITDGRRLCVNQTGNPGMATGGSGDVLAGIILSLLGQGLDPFSAAAAGAWIHGAAGDLCARRLGENGLMPSDIVQAVPQILKKRERTICGIRKLLY